MDWKDTTSYSRGAEHRPTTWTAHAGGLRITVTSSHVYYPGQWVFHCRPFFDTYRLGAETKEEAQARAVELVAAEIAAVVAALDSAGDTTKGRV